MAQVLLTLNEPSEIASDFYQPIYAHTSPVYVAIGLR